MKNLKKKFIFTLVAAVIASTMVLSSSALSVIRVGSNSCDTGSDTAAVAAANTSNADCSSAFDVQSILSKLNTLCSNYASSASDSTDNTASVVSTASLPKDVQSYVDTILQNTNCDTANADDTSSKAASDTASTTSTVSETANTTSSDTSSSAADTASSTCNAASCDTNAACIGAGCTSADQCGSGTCNTSGNCLSGSGQCNVITGVVTGSNGNLNDYINSVLGQLGITQSGCGTTTSSNSSSNTTSSSGSSSSGTSSKDNDSSQTPSGSGSSSSGQNIDNLSFEEQVVELVNEQRAAYGLSPLTLNTELSKVARIKSQDMHDNNYFSHTSPTYGSPFEMMTTFGISYRTAGENIAMGYTTPEAVMNGWMNSEGHRANILNASYTEIGVGYVADGNYWTQEFIG